MQRAQKNLAGATCINKNFQALLSRLAFEDGLKGGRMVGLLLQHHYRAHIDSLKHIPADIL